MLDTLLEELENDIIFGVYAPGHRLTEDQVMERYAVKRHAAREAFSELKICGLLVHKRNRGVEVISYTPDEIDAIYEIRIILETAAAQRTPLPVSKTNLASLKAVATKHQKAAKDKDFRTVFALNNEFHRIQYECCNNERLVKLIEEYARIIQPIRVVKYDDVEHMRIVVEQHFELIKTMQGTRQSAYVEATRRHLPASAKAYRALYENRFGKKQA